MKRFQFKIEPNAWVYTCYTAGLKEANQSFRRYLEERYRDTFRFYPREG